ncbi:MAG: hypothetical protein ACP5OH_06770, partial [Nitrososphaerota archaeon]
VMNISESEEQYEITATTCIYETKSKVTYSIVDSYHVLSKDKRDIILSEMCACERLKKYARDELDARAIEIEISELKLILDLLS